MRYPKFVNKIILKANAALSSFSEIVQQIIIIISTFAVLFWLSVFLYGSFYFYYVPVVLQEKPVYFHFRVCESGVGLCSFPVANISLVKEGKNEVFKSGQLYKIVLDLDLPESENNRMIGMFMIEMRLYNKHGEIVQTSARAVSTSLHYKSSLLRILETFAFAPFFLFGYMNQKQLLHVELFPEFLDNAYNPSVGLVIEVQSMKVEIYSALLKIFAQFSGIRYFLYYWPVTSAIVGISWNFLCLSFVALLSWYQFWLPWKQDEINPPIKIKLFKNRKPPSPKKTSKAALSRADSSSSDIETIRADATDETELLAPVSSSQELLSPVSGSQEDLGLRLRRPY